jgi:hypothetical protein
MNFKRKKTRRQVRCIHCTSNRWLGNNKSGGYCGHKPRVAKALRNRVEATEVE